MQSAMKTSSKQTLQSTGDTLTLFPVDSLVSPTPLQVNGLAKRTPDTSGRKCLDVFEKFNRNGLWVKMFSALLIGQGDWFSTKCNLTWKLKVTKYKRMYFQLAPSTPRTEEIGFGLLRTPTTQEPGINAENLTDKDGNPAQIGSRAYTKTGRLVQVGITQQVQMMGLLKTPTKMDGEVSSGKKNPVSGNSGTLAQEIMSQYPPTMAKLGLLPTPRASKISGTDREDFTPSLPGLMNKGLLPFPQVIGDTGKPEQQILRVGKDSQQLNPQFVGEMMGFPEGWTELPFLSGEMSLSKPTEMP